MSDRLRTEDPELLFVYDRVCTQDEKNREMGQRFGVGVGVTGASREQPYRGSFADEGRRRSEEAARDPSSAPSRPGLNADGSDTGEFSRPRRSAAETFASSEGTREYAPAASFSRRTGSGGAGAFAFASHGDPSRGAAGAKASEPAGENRAYTYRPGTPEGGEAAAERRKRPGPEWFADIFVSRQARGKEEAREIKKSAAAEQRAREYRHAAVTALILTVVLALSAFLVYRIVFVIDQIEIGGSDRYSAAEIAGVVGIEEGDGLYSFRSAEVSAAVTFRMPWVKSAEIVRSAPKKVAVLLTDDEARYYANVWGDTVLLSPGLRVLSVSAEAPDTTGLVRLILPPVDKSVAGRAIEFSSPRSERYVRSVLASASDSSLFLNGLLEEIDLRSEYDVRMKASGLYDLKCGGESNMTAKLRMAYEIVMSGQLAEGIPASMDLTAVEPVSVIHDYSAARNP